MTIETATYIADLVPANPAAGDPKSEGDDHIRLIKSVLQNTLPDTENSAGITVSTHFTLLNAKLYKIHRRLAAFQFFFSNDSVGGSYSNIATLPAGYLPAVDMVYGARVNGIWAGTAQITTGGVVSALKYDGTTPPLGDAVAFSGIIILP